MKHYLPLCSVCSRCGSSSISSSSSSSLQLLHAGRRGSAGFAPQPAADHRGPAALHLLRRRPQHPLRQFLPAPGPRRLPVEPGGRRGRVGLLRHLRPRGPVVEPGGGGVKGQGLGQGGEQMGKGWVFNWMPYWGRKHYTMKPSLFYVWLLLRRSFPSFILLWY